MYAAQEERISSFKKEDKAKIVSQFKVNDIIKNAEVKGFSSFGAFSLLAQLTF